MYSGGIVDISSISSSTIPQASWKVASLAAAENIRKSCECQLTVTNDPSIQNKEVPDKWL